MSKFVGIVILATIVSSCGNYVYKPVTVKPQFFEKKGDLEASMNTAGMLELHAAGAVTNHISAGFTYSSLGTRDTTFRVDTPTQISRPYSYRRDRYRDFEISAGYFRRINDQGAFEVLGGIAFTKRSVEDFLMNKTKLSENFTNPYMRYFIQPSFGINREFFDVGLVSRMQWISYSNNKTDFILEPGFFARFGYRNVKLMYQMGLLAVSRKSSYDYWPITIGFGLYFQMNNWTKKPENREEY